jgi:hypothetical protein
MIALTFGKDERRSVQSPFPAASGVRSLARSVLPSYFPRSDFSEQGISSMPTSHNTQRARARARQLSAAFRRLGGIYQGSGYLRGRRHAALCTDLPRVSHRRDNRSGGLYRAGIGHSYVALALRLVSVVAVTNLSSI